MRDDAKIWEDFQYEAEQLVKLLQQALIAARKVTREMVVNGNISGKDMRKVRRKVDEVNKVLVQLQEIEDLADGKEG